MNTEIEPVESGSVEWHLTEILSDGLDKMIRSDLHYLSFMIMVQTIELLGSVCDDGPLSTYYSRFKAALVLLPTLEKYKVYNYGPHDLFDNLYPMASGGCPGPGIVITQKTDPVCGNKHLQIHQFNKKPRLILVSEDLWGDIKAAIAWIISAKKRENIKTFLKQNYFTPNLNPDPVLVTVQAIQWDGTESGIDFIQLSFPTCPIETMSMPLIQKDTSLKLNTALFINTSNGKREVKPGSFVIRGVNEKYTIMEEDIFNGTKY